MSNKVNDENVTSCTDELKNVHITSTDEVDVCANCGEEGSDGLKACTACKMVKYCNRDIVIVKLHIDQSTRKHAENELLRYAKKNYSNNLRQQKIVPSVSFVCHYFHRGQRICHVVEKVFAVDAVMQPCTII